MRSNSNHLCVENLQDLDRNNKKWLHPVLSNLYMDDSRLNPIWSYLIHMNVLWTSIIWCPRRSGFGKYCSCVVSIIHFCICYIWHVEEFQMHPLWIDIFLCIILIDKWVAFSNFRRLFLFHDVSLVVFGSIFGVKIKSHMCQINLTLLIWNNY